MVVVFTVMVVIVIVRRVIIIVVVVVLFIFIIGAYSEILTSHNYVFFLFFSRCIQGAVIVSHPDVAVTSVIRAGEPLDCHWLIFSPTEAISILMSDRIWPAANRVREGKTIVLKDGTIAFLRASEILV